VNSQTNERNDQEDRKILLKVAGFVYSPLALMIAMGAGLALS
jgi:hypothetical protein